MLYSNKAHYLTISANCCVKNTKFIVHERDKQIIKYFVEKSFSVLRGVNGTHQKTLKLFWLHSLLIFSRTIFFLLLLVQDFLHNI